MLGLATSVLCMYDVEKHSAALENVSGFVRRDTYIYGPVTKWQHWVCLYTMGVQTSRSPKRCTSRNAMSVEFLEVQIPPCVLVYD